MDIVGPVEEVVRIVQNECPQSCSPAGERRIKPVVISRLSRGGKTTIGLKLFAGLKTLGVLPIFISFNGSSNFRHRNDETHEHAILRRIAVQFTDEDDDFNLDVDRKTLLNYIDTDSNGKKVVLIIDELNMLSDKLDESAANLLRSEFLDKENRYLVITSHIPLDLDVTCNAASVLGKRPSIVSASERGVYVVHLPLSTDLLELRTMSDACRALTPFEVVFYGGIPSLIYSIKGGQFDPMQRIESYILSEGMDPSITITPFLDLVLNGLCDNSKLSIFSRFGSAGTASKIQFPLCYINALLVKWFKLAHFEVLYQEMQSFGAKVQTGLDWETLVQYAVMMRCVLASNHKAYRGPFDILPANTEVEFLFLTVPGEIVTIEAMIDYVQNKLLEYTGPMLVMVNCQFAKFPTFDGFVWYHAPAASNAVDPAKKIVGYQCKLGKEGTVWEIPPSISKGVLVRGKPADTTFEKEKWVYLAKDTLNDFLGYSLQPLVPANWPEMT